MTSRIAMRGFLSYGTQNLETPTCPDRHLNYPAYSLVGNPIHNADPAFSTGENSTRLLAPVFDLNEARRRSMSRRRFSRQELADTAAGLRRLLDAIATEEITADPGTVARLEGAILALEALSDDYDR